MIAARPAGRNLAARLHRHAAAIAKRRARQIASEANAANWRSADALWPDFGTD